MDIRDIVTKKFETMFENCVDDNNIFWNDSDDIARLSHNLEKSILNQTIRDSEHVTGGNFDATFDDPKFRRRYKTYFQKVYFNLFINDCAKDVQQRVKNGDLKLRDIVSTHHVDLNPEIMIEAKKRYDHLLFVSGQSDQMKMMQSERKSGIKCAKCKSDKVEYTQLQTRSGDEGISNFALCVCGHRWKFS